MFADIPGPLLNLIHLMNNISIFGGVFVVFDTETGPLRREKSRKPALS